MCVKVRWTVTISLHDWKLKIILSQYAICFCRKHFNISYVVYCTEFNIKATNNFDYLTSNNTHCSVLLACHFQILKKSKMKDIFFLFSSHRLIIPLNIWINLFYTIRLNLKKKTTKILIKENVIEEHACWVVFSLIKFPVPAQYLLRLAGLVELPLPNQGYMYN